MTSSRRTRWRTSRRAARSVHPPPPPPHPALPSLPTTLPTTPATRTHTHIRLLPGAGKDPGQGGHPARSAAPDLRGQAARGRPHPLRLQHPEGEHAAPGAASARRSWRRRGRRQRGRWRRRRAAVRSARCHCHVRPVGTRHLHDLAADLARGGRDRIHPGESLRCARRGACRPPPLRAQHRPAPPHTMGDPGNDSALASDVCA